MAAATKAAYEAMLERGKALVAGRYTSLDDMPDLFRRISTESETAQVLIFGSYLEDRFRSSVLENLQNMDDSDAEERLFGGFGPLASFSSRILLAYHLGWISLGIKSRLDAFRKLRNEFAHNAFRASFADHPIEQLIRKVAGSDRGVVAAMQQAASAAAEDGSRFEERRLTRNHAILCDFAVLAARSIEELAVFAVAKDCLVRPEDLRAAVRSSQSKGDTGMVAARTVLEMFARTPLAGTE